MTRTPVDRRWLLLVTAAVLFGALVAGGLGSARGSFVDTTGNAASAFEATDWTKWIEIDGGREYSCAANGDGSVWCWGKNNVGQLGDGTATERHVPVQVTGGGGVGYLDDVVDVATGYEFACAVLDDGSVWCWGRGDKGQLGNGGTADSLYPIQVDGVGGSGTLSGIVDVDAGEKHACAAASDGSVYCWGENNVGQLGDGTSTQRNSPVQTITGSGSSDYASVDFSTGTFSDDDGTIPWNAAWQEIGEANGESAGNVWVYSWAYCTTDSCLTIGANGTSFDGKGASRAVDVSGYDTATLSYDFQQSQASALSGTLAVQVSSDGSSWTTLKTYSQTGPVTSPVPESFDITAYISATTSIRMLGSGSVDGWFNFDDVRIDVTATGGGSAGSVGIGLDHSCAVAATGTVQCWGEGSDGQIGDGGTSDRSTPQTVLGVGGTGTLSGVVEVDGGNLHTCARHSDGSLTCWGDNLYGQMAPTRPGDGTVIWKRGGDNKPDQAAYTVGSGLGSTYEMADVGQWRIIQGASSGGSDAIVVGVDTNEKIHGQRFSGSSWSQLPFNDLATVTDSFWWSFDVAYESQSGDAVLVWNNGTSGTAGITYRVFDGTSWSGASTITTPIAGEPKQMQLAAAPDSDEMVLVVSNGSGNDYALVWSGSAWGNAVSLSTSADNLTEVNVAYEQTSGDALVIHGKLSDEMYYRTWNGTSWSSEGSITVPTGTSTSSSSRWSTIASDPTSDRVVIGVHNQVNDGWVAIWDGSAWGNKLTVTNGGSGTNHPWMAVAFEGVSGDALVTYGEDVRYVKYRTWPAGGSWGAEQTGPDMGTGEFPNSMVLYPRPTTNDIMLVVNDDDSDLEMYPWNGSSWGTYSQPTTDTGETKNQPFLFLWGFVGDTGTPPTSSTSPLQVFGHSDLTWSDAADVGLGETHSCATTDGGAAYCWGRNSSGEIGDGTTTQRATPTRVVGSGGSGTLDDVTVIGGGWGIHTCASVADAEELWCWGRNNKGQLGDNSTSDSSTPVFAKGST